MGDFTGLTILYAEDETTLRERISMMLAMDGATVVTADNGSDASRKLKDVAPDVLISDIRMPVMDGLALTQLARDVYPELPVILCTAFTETEYLMRVIDLGVTSCIKKPVDYDHLAETISRVSKVIVQRHKIKQLEEEASASITHILGNSPAMHDVVDKARRFAASKYSLLLQGKTGSGKSHLARLIHNMGKRRDAPFVTVQLASIPDALAESVLFGHAKGAFTNAIMSRQGVFRQADGGTLFLDDIDAAPPSIQAKVLQAVEERSVNPLGTDKYIAVDVRIIAATNKDLKGLVASGGFREDLYYRLKVISGKDNTFCGDTKFF